jgi:NTP pyrophosphatase (non-canonical NTP hydrolase)
MVTNLLRKSDKDKDLADEMADVLWVLVCLANQTGVNLSDATHKEYRERKPHETSSGIQIIKS